MANRPVYAAGKGEALCRVHLVEFEYQRGLSKVQRQRSSMKLREAYLEDHPQDNVLEVSRFSEDVLGTKLSAFNLTIQTKDGRKMPVECAFQGGKIMKEYGQLVDLYDKTPAETKADPRRTNGTLIGFVFDGEEFGLNPKTAFYNWVYIHALMQNPEIGDLLMEYDAFTDIAFNPEKAVNCQAEACAYYVALRRRGLLEEALKNKEAFIETLYRVKPKSTGKIGAMAGVKSEKPATGAAVKEEKKNTVPDVVMKVGDEVTHPKFGAGVITKIDGDGESEILSVKFAVGEKKIAKSWLAQAMAKMKA